MMAMRAYDCRRARTAGPPQRPLLGKNVARGELARAGEGEIFAHGVVLVGTSVPRLVEKALRFPYPAWYTTQSALFGEILGYRPDQCIELFVVRQRRLLGDRCVASVNRWREVKCIDEFSQRNVLRS